MIDISKHKKILSILASVLIIVVAFKFSSTGDVIAEVEMELEMDNLVKNQIKVHVVGAVVNEGVYELDEGKRVEDAINLAGGLLPEANIEMLNYARLVKDGEKISVLKEKKETQSSEGEGVSITKDPDYSLLEKINYMTAENFQEVPGIGSVISEEIIKLREDKGQFASVEELKEVSGIGTAKLSKIIDYIQ